MEDNRLSNLTEKVIHFKPQHLKNLQKIIKNPDSGIVIWAITGVAGCGKSELAKVYALESDAVFKWRLDPDPDSSCNDAGRVFYEDTYFGLLQNFHLDSLKADPEEKSENFRERRNSLLWLTINELSPWIVIFDNAVKYDDLRRYLPTDPQIRGQILITSQNQNFFLVEQYCTMSINQGLDPPEAVQLLHDMMYPYDPIAKDSKVDVFHLNIECSIVDSQVSNVNHITDLNIVNALDYSPLAVRIAGTYLRNVRCSYSEYLDRLQLDLQDSLISRDLIGQAAKDHRRNITLKQAIRLSLQQLQSQAPRIVTLLEDCAYLSNIDIPERLLEKLWLQKADSNMILDRAYFQQIGRIEGNYSLLTYNLETNSYYLHRMTQVICRKSTRPPIEVLQKVVLLLLELCPYLDYSIDMIRNCQELAPHLISLHQHIMVYHSGLQTLQAQHADLLLLLGQIYFEYNQYPLALQYFHQAWNLSSASPLRQVEILRYQADIKLYLLDYIGSGSDLDNALAIANQVFCSPDWHVARIHNQRGRAFLAREDPMHCDLAKALDEHTVALKLCEQPTSEQLKLELTESNLYISRCYRQLGQFEDTFKYLQNAIGQTPLSKSHPWTANIFIDLGILGLFPDWETFHNRGVDYETSRQYLEHSQSVYIQTYGFLYVETARLYHWMSTLWLVSDKREDWKIALEYRNKEIDIQKRIIGRRCQHLITSYYWQGRIFQKLGEDVNAKNAYETSQQIGLEHPGRLNPIIQDCKEKLQSVRQMINSANSVLR